MKHLNEPIFISGKPGDKGVVTFQHTDQNGDTTNIALMINKGYFVGGLDENHKVIEDWVYDLYKDCDYNNNRQKNKAERKSEKSLIEEGGKVNNRVALIS